MTQQDVTARRRKGRQLVTIPNGIDIIDDNNDDDYTFISNPNNDTATTSKRRKRKKRKSKDPSFLCLFVQVGFTLLVICLVLYRIHSMMWPAGNQKEQQYEGYDDKSYNEYQDDDDSAAAGNAGNDYNQNEQNDGQNLQLGMMQQQQQQQQRQQQQPFQPKPLPKFNLSLAAEWDAFGILDGYLKDQLKDHNVASDSMFWSIAKGLRQKFAETYGGTNAARMILDRGITTFATSNSANNIPSDIVHTACRIQRAQNEQRPFVMTFGGYSVTAGRGNYFAQSFPLVLQDYLHAAFSTFDIKLQITNAAIGGCPSFPYGWCMPNFWGTNPDVVSWDYSMNEAGGIPEGLEAYIRHVLQLPSRPKLIVKDTHMAPLRQQVLSKYHSLLKDSIVLHSDPAVRPFLDLNERDRPIGFQDWRKFGAPPGAPGQAFHHPAVKEHEFLAWLLCMHFLTSLQLLQSNDPILSTTCPGAFSDNDGYPVSLPPPVSGNLTNTTTMEYPSVLFGKPTKSNSSIWTMNPIHCRTSFEPLIQGDLTSAHDSIVVSGSVGENFDWDLPKSNMFYHQGWTMDLSAKEKAAKRKLNLYTPSLGFVDTKKAYYGLYASGALSVLLPFENLHNDDNKDTNNKFPKVGDKASDWFQSVIICQVNEKREHDECQAEKDIGVIVGGVNVTSIDSKDNSMMNNGGTLYLGMKLCRYIKVPNNATLQTKEYALSHHHDTEAAVHGRNLDVHPFDHSKDSDMMRVGLSLDIYVHNQHLVRPEQACSVSHIIWEQVSR